MTVDDKKPDEEGDDKKLEEGTKDDARRFTDDDFKAHVDQNKKEHEEMFARIAALEKSKTKDDDDDKKDDKTKDAAFTSDGFKKMVAHAEILIPGVRIPTLDYKASNSDKMKTMTGFQRKVLDQFYSTKEGKEIIDDLLPSGTSYKGLTCDSIYMIFNSPAMVKVASNNKAEVSFHKVETYPHIKSIADLNAFNEKFWGSK